MHFKSRNKNGSQIITSFRILTYLKTWLESQFFKKMFKTKKMAQDDRK